MGMGFTFKCSKCGYELEANMGFGYLFPQVAEETIKDMKSGKYGETAEKFFQENPDGSVDCSNELFLCKKCGALKVDMALDLYIRKEGVAEPKYPFPDEEYFSKAMEIDHICEKCGNKMEKQNERQFLKKVQNGKVRCPDCDGHLELADFFNWD